jgi:GNAT superfamily N-acetyltransferase
MSSVEVRSFRREDRDQLTALVNVHTAAVVPGVSVAVNSVLSQLEREPGEFIVDPWVGERATFVAEQRGRVVAAAHLLRYAGDESVGESYRGVGEIRWFLFWPDAPFWPDSTAAAETLLAACVAQLDRWSVSRQLADGALPAPGVYGVPEQWPHIRSLYERAGFAPEGNVEIVYLAEVGRLPASDAREDLVVRRSVGINGTRLTAARGDDAVGYIELDLLESLGRFPAHSGWADVGNLHVAEAHRRQGIATWLVGQAAEWLRLAGVQRLLGYANADEEASRAFLDSVGFRELTRTERGWARRP